MAEVQSIQCPKCGSPLEVTPSTTQARCSYCGSVLHVSRDTSGQLLAVLEGIRTDTDILATDVVARLGERLRALRRSRDDLSDQHAAAKKRATWLKIVGGIILVVAFLVYRNGSIYCASICLLISLLPSIWESKHKKLAKRYKSTLCKLDVEIAETERRLRAVVARMDRLGEEL